ncbi:MAG: helix-turn-helix transcriptional regulator [Chloroflexi bacterium]|nr:helix-turn-helix transcriptional regulator [Chloroflexota bacterium]
MLREIDKERERAGLTKADLARRIGTDPAAVRRLFSARTSNPTLATVLGMADALGMRVEVVKPK